MVVHYIVVTLTGSAVLYGMHRAPMGYPHGLINHKDTKTKCRHLIKLTCKGIPLPSPLPCVKVQYKTLCGWEGVGVLSFVGDPILQESNTVLDQIQKLQNF